MMKEFQQRRILQRFLRSKVLVVLFLVLFFLMAKATFNIYGKFSESRSRRLAAESELVRLKSRADALAEDVARLKTSKGIEEEIRRQFNMVKEGEELAIIVNPSSDDDVSSDKIKGGWWRSILDLFGMK